MAGKTPKTDALYDQWNEQTDYIMANRALRLCEKLESDLKRLKREISKQAKTVLAVRIRDFYQVTCPHCGSQTRFFDTREDGTQKCIDCRKVLQITKPSD